MYSKYEQSIHFKNVNLYLMLNKLMNKLIFIRNLKTIALRIWLTIFKWLKKNIRNCTYIIFLYKSDKFCLSELCLNVRFNVTLICSSKTDITFLVLKR